MPVRTPRPRTLAVLSAGTALVVAGLTAPAAAAGPRASWQMNEAAGATVMVDSSGHGLDGTIGAQVQTHVSSAGRTGYFFSHTTNGKADPADPQRLVTVPNNALLNPGSGDYSVTITTRFSPSANYRNLMQKGQTGTPGGFFKLEVDRGGVTCLFRGSSGSGAVGTGMINDSAWHTLTCARTAGAVTMTVDGRQTARRSVVTGTISNSMPLAIGGKPACASATVECDYFAGYVDSVVIN